MHGWVACGVCGRAGVIRCGELAAVCVMLLLVVRGMGAGVAGCAAGCWVVLPLFSSLVLLLLYVRCVSVAAVLCGRCDATTVVCRCDTRCA